MSDRHSTRASLRAFGNGSSDQLQALMVAEDPELRFDLALELGMIDKASDIMETEIDKNAGDDEPLSTDTAHKWKKLGASVT